jgi:hypothetical protein
MQNLGISGLIFGLVGLAISIGIFILLRGLVLWYYKIDERIKKQDEIINLLKENNKLLERLDK